MRWTVAALLASLSACAAAPAVELRVVVVGEDPFLGADTTEVRVRSREGQVLALERVRADEVAFALGPLPFGEPLTVEVETRIGTLPLALGRSFPFVVPSATDAPSRRADVTLGLLGRHAPVATLSASGPVRVLPDARGAALVGEDAVVPFLAHGPDGRPTLDTPRPVPADRRGAAAIALGDGVLLVGGAAPGASVLGPGGALRSIDGPGLEAVRGAALAGLDGAVLVIGGRSADGALLAEVTRVRLDGGEVRVEPLPPLPRPRAFAQAVPFLALGSAGATPRVLLEGGEDPAGETFELVVLDPAGEDAPIAWTSPRPRRGCAVAPVEAGQVMLAGGVDPAGQVVGDVDVLVVDVERPWVLLAPAPDPLFRARAGAVAVPLAPGLSLVVGGTNPSGAAIEATELADLRLVPGRVRLTGSLPAAAGTTDAAVLADGTMLVAAGAHLSLYFPFPP